MPRYLYEGSVYYFDKEMGWWKAETWAPTPAKAKSNLAYRYKKEHNLPANARITLRRAVKEIA